MAPLPRLFFIFPQSLDSFARSGRLQGPGVRPASEARHPVSPAGPQIPLLRRGRKNPVLCLPSRVPSDDQRKALGPAASGLRSGCGEGIPSRARQTYGREPGVRVPLNGTQSPSAAVSALQNGGPVGSAWDNG